MPIAELGINDVALVTGGLNGLGVEIVKLLLETQNLGAIYILDVQRPPTMLCDKVKFVECDLASPEALSMSLDHIYSSLDGRNLSVVVNNAGIRGSGSVLNVSDSTIRKVFEVNFFAPIHIMREVTSRHLQRPSDKRLSLVNVSSILGTLGPKNLLAYSASKAASIQAHECFAEEMRPFDNITTLLVLPGQLTTEMFRDVSPSRLFFAPLVDHKRLAQQIVQKIAAGEEGVLCEPFYANFLPFVKVMPIYFQRLARWISQMDEKIGDEAQ